MAGLLAYPSFPYLLFLHTSLTHQTYVGGVWIWIFKINYLMHANEYRAALFGGSMMIEDEIIHLCAVLDAVVKSFS